MQKLETVLENKNCKFLGNFEIKMDNLSSNRLKTLDKSKSAKILTSRVV